jgi:hypothetical protein
MKTNTAMKGWELSNLKRKANKYSDSNTKLVAQNKSL